MSMGPALLSDGQVLLAGKSRIVYLLNGADLGGVGRQEASLGPACSDDIDGGSAVVGATVYLPCLSGTVAVQVTAAPPRLSLRWSSRTDGGPPIVAAGLVWTIGQNGTLYGLDPSTGAVRQHASIGVPANHFSTPSVGDGLLLAASADRVVAFGATVASTPTAPAPKTTKSAAHQSHPISKAKSAGNGGVVAGVVAGIVAGCVILLIGVCWLFWRRRRTGSFTGRG
jgi:outer membrane protein assembly factor BamB